MSHSTNTSDEVRVFDVTNITGSQLHRILNAPSDTPSELLSDTRLDALSNVTTRPSSDTRTILNADAFADVLADNDAQWYSSRMSSSMPVEATESHPIVSSHLIKPPDPLANQPANQPANQSANQPANTVFVPMSELMDKLTKLAKHPSTPEFERFNAIDPATQLYANPSTLHIASHIPAAIIESARNVPMEIIPVGVLPLSSQSAQLPVQPPPNQQLQLNLDPVFSSTAPPPPLSNLRVAWSQVKAHVRGIPLALIPSCLVLEGSDLACYAYIESLERIRKLGILPRIRNYASVNFGAVICFMLSCGIKLDVIKAQLDTYTLGPPKPRWRTFIKSRWSLYDDKHLNKWINDVIIVCTNDLDITFQQLHARYGTYLSIGVSALHTRTHVSLSRNTHPDMKIALALRMTMSLVGKIPPVFYAGGVYVDGGITNNYPIHVFSDCQVIGMMLVNRLGYAAAITTANSYINAITACYVMHQQYTPMTESEWRATIKINCADINTDDIGPLEKEKLTKVGSKAVINHYSKAAMPQNAYFAKLP